MLVVKDNPVGADWHIQKVQAAMYAKLAAKWNTALYNAYGRCYRNKNDGGYIAEVYIGNNEYKEVYWDDSLAAISFFGINNIKNSGTNNTADVHLVFFVDLAKLKPDITHRADEEVRQDVHQAVGKNSFGLTFQSVDLWIENVLKEYPGSRRDDRLKAVDMHPVHCFRFNYTLTYNPNKTC